METIRQYLPLIVPLILLQLVLIVFALRDLAQRQKTRGPRWLWAVIILFGELIGPVVYFLVGREDE